MVHDKGSYYEDDVVQCDVVQGDVVQVDVLKVDVAQDVTPCRVTGDATGQSRTRYVVRD